MLKQRIVTALILFGVLVGSLLWSPTAFLVLSTVVIALALAEWLQLAGWLRTTALAAAGIYAALLLAAALMAPRQLAALLLPVCVLSGLIWLVIVLTLTRADAVARPMPRLATTLAALLLSGAAWLALVHFLGRGAVALLSVLFIVWIADTAAYFAGRAWGRRKLAPHISPGKTWVGVYGAMAAVLVVAALAWLAAPDAPLFSNGIFAKLGWIALIPLAVMVVASVAGDLYESLIKRQANVKDSSQLLPGHGGVYDRIDALVPLLPLAALIDTLVR